MKRISLFRISVLITALIVAISCGCLSDFDAARSPETSALNITLLSDGEGSISQNESSDFTAYIYKEINRLDVYHEELADALPGKPIFVHSLYENYSSYYLLPFVKDGYLSLVAWGSIRDDGMHFGGVYAPTLLKTEQEAVDPTLESAKKVLLKNGYDGNWSARLVWKPCKQTHSPVHPVWEFARDDGKKIYVTSVGYNPVDDRIQIYDKLTKKTIAG